VHGCYLKRLTFALLLSSATALGQGRTIRGTVVDSAGKGIAFAVVTAIASERYAEADENGRFQLQLEQSESCSLWTRRLGFHSTTLKLPSCPDTALRIVLTRTPRGDSGPRCGTRSTEVCAAPNVARLETISAGQTHSCALEPDGTAWCWGDGQKGALGDGATSVQRWPERVLTKHRFTQIAAGGSFTCAVTTDGKVLCWGTSEVVPNWPKPARQPAEVGAVGVGIRLTAGRRHACILDGEGRASCWGWNVDGETGTGTSGIISSLIATPAAVVGDHRFASISAGSNFTCGVTTAGQVLCWGNNVDGVLGEQAVERCGDVEPVPCSSRPVEIRTPEPMRQVSSGTSHACAIGVSATVYCWGANGYGQLGRVGPTTMMPQPLSSAEKFTTIASGGIETCAITTGNALFCWGADPRRRNTNDLAADDVRPRLVARNIRNVSLGQTHSCAVTRAGAVLCWGDTILGAFGSR
jgi:alpha-tubulin suppressor-like RCC1 family protein